MKKNVIVQGEPLSYSFAYAYPEAHTFFVEYISKAYQALTDPVSRENYEKYGHPDGRQVMLELFVHKTSLKLNFTIIYTSYTPEPNLKCPTCMIQGLQMGIALPKFLLNIDGASGGIMLLGIVGFCILLPLMIAVIYLSRSSKYTGNYVMHQTLSTYYYFMKPSLAPRYDFLNASYENLTFL